ncbi:formin-like protein 1 [Cydia fagiglandana]|uniref:formin-like protein 1 n=1 Tax=Cydia fagiglandana TaxID=1458189 RepID=UPI002FEE1597
MTTRRDVLVAKMQQLQKELKTAEELNKRLLQEQEESAEQFEQVVRINTTLKSQLANQDVEFEDMQGQRDELQAAVDQFKNCQEIHEQALQRIQDLEQQLEESETKHSCKYCSGHSGLRDNNLSIFAEINSFDVDSVDDSIGFSPMLRGDSEPAPRVADPAPPPPSSPPSRAEQVPSGPGRAEPTPSLPCLVEPAPSPPSLVKLALSLLTYVEPAPSPPSPVSPAPSPPGLPSPAPAPPRLGSGAAPPPPPRRPRAAGRRTLLYSDEVGAGLGVLLAQRLSQGVVNHCHPGASVDRLIESISAGEFDRDSTLYPIVCGATCRHPLINGASFVPTHKGGPSNLKPGNNGHI